MMPAVTRLCLPLPPCLLLGAPLATLCVHLVAAICKINRVSEFLTHPNVPLTRDLVANHDVLQTLLSRNGSGLVVCPE